MSHNHTPAPSRMRLFTLVAAGTVGILVIGGAAAMALAGNQAPASSTAASTATASTAPTATTTPTPTPTESADSVACHALVDGSRTFVASIKAEGGVTEAGLKTYTAAVESDVAVASDPRLKSALTTMVGQLKSPDGVSDTVVFDTCLSTGGFTQAEYDTFMAEVKATSAELSKLP